MPPRKIFTGDRFERPQMPPEHQDPSYTRHDRIVDRIRHALVFAEASERCLRELLALIEQAEAENDG